MRSVEKSGRTVEEAKALALAELGADAADVDIEVLEEPRSGLFGLLGSRPAVVRVTEREHCAKRLQIFLSDVFAGLGVDVTMKLSEGDQLIQVDIFGSEAGILIGRHGQTLDALQLLTNLALGRSAAGRRIILDVEGYRRRREETLSRLAVRMAERVHRTGQRVVLEPMTAQERRIIHIALSDHPHVETVSEGEGADRRVAIYRR